MNGSPANDDLDASSEDQRAIDDAVSEAAAKERVGYRHPPSATRFPPGRSGNPRGRPKGARNLNAIVAAALGERVAVKDNGRRRSVTKLEAAVTQLVNRAATGEIRATQLLLALVQANEARPPESQPGKIADADALVMSELARRFGPVDREVSP